MRHPIGLFLLLFSLAAAAEEGVSPGDSAPPGIIRLDETVISGNQELPKVLYILPWRDPSGLPEIELEARNSELDVFRRLYPPAYRRELTYFESLEAAKSTLGTANSSEE